MERPLDHGRLIDICPSRIKTPEVPRYSWPIFIGIALSFPDRVVRDPIGVNNRISDFAPYAVALNEFADIGISAEIKLSESVASQDQYLPLRRVSNTLRCEMNKRQYDFDRSNNGLRNVSEIIKNDFLLLSELREGLDPIDFLELDSGIIEAGYLEVAIPGVCQEVGIDLDKDCKTVNDLKDKYSLFMLSTDDEISYSEGQMRVRELHAMSMIMKMQDDEENKHHGSFDELVGLPNFVQWSKSHDTDERCALNEKLNFYRSVASSSYIKRGGTYGISALFSVSAAVKNRLSKNGIEPIDDLFRLSQEASRFFTRKCTTLRHQLMETGMLNEAFR